MKALELNPEYKPAYRISFFTYCRMGENSKAVEALYKMMLVDTATIHEAKIIKDVYNKAGINGVWNWLITQELEKSKPSTWQLARYYASINNSDEALNWLEKAYKIRDPTLPRVCVDPCFNNLRSEPRYLKLIDQMGLSEYH